MRRFFRVFGRLFLVSVAGGFTVLGVAFIQLFGALWTLEFMAFARNGKE
jgi:hypothetical protein